MAGAGAGAAVVTAGVRDGLIGCNPAPLLQGFLLLLPTLVRPWLPHVPFCVEVSQAIPPIEELLATVQATVPFQIDLDCNGNDNNWELFRLAAGAAAGMSILEPAELPQNSINIILKRAIVACDADKDIQREDAG